MRAADVPLSPSQAAAPSEHIEDLYLLRRRLLFGGGALISLLVVLTAVFSAFSGIRDFHARERHTFTEGQAAVNFFLLQRDRAYAGSINGNDALWSERRAELELSGRADLERFNAQGGEVLVQASGPSAVPWLVLGLHDRPMPAPELAAYLGMIEFYSAYTAATVTSLETAGQVAIYGYEPQGRLLAVAGVRDEAQLLQILRVSTRKQAFARLLDEEAGMRQQAPEPGPVSSAMQGQRLVSRFGVNPFTGDPSLVGIMTLADGRTPYFRRVVFEQVENIKARLELARPDTFLVVAADGTKVLSTGGLDGSVLEALSRWVASHPRSLVYEERVGSRYVIYGELHGVNWRLAHVYGWRELWADRGASLLWTTSVALVILLMLWLTLLWMDRRIFVPALVDARRVYESDALSGVIIGTSPVGLALIAREDGRPLLQNELARTLAEADGEDARGEGAAHEVPALYRQLATQVTPDTELQRLVLHWPPTSEQRQLEVSMAVATYLDRPVWVCALRDVTVQAELEVTLRKARLDSERAKEAAEAASQAKSSFVANMSHEIRTPLNGVLGHLELLARSPLELDQRERLDRIRQSADALMGIISDVLDFSKIEAGQLDIDPIQFDLRSMVEQAVLLFAPEATRKGLRLLQSIEVPPAQAVVADMHRIRQIINNLISNAVKFTESGRILVQAEVVASGDPQQAHLTLSVIDSGVGLSPEQAQQLFQPFQQADASISRRFGGTGLGLALCGQLAQALGGRIGVESTLGVGSVFTLMVPVRIVGVQDPAMASLSGMQVTLLASSAEWRSETTRLLRYWGAEVTMIERPGQPIDPGRAGQVLLVVGEISGWDANEIEQLAARHTRWIHAHATGLLVPAVRGNFTEVTCHSSSALRAALAPADTADSPQAMPPTARHRRGEGGKKILLVEDNPVNLELIQQQLEELGYSVEAMSSATTALSAWTADAYLAVLTDINMPHMDGYAFARQLRARGETLPILAVTATALASERERCRQAGIDDLLLKPLALDRLAEVLARYVPVATLAGEPLPGATAAEAPETEVHRRAYPAKLRRLFVDVSRKDLASIASARAGGDSGAVLDRVHSLKGALLMLSERDLAQRCGQIEASLRGGAGLAEQPMDAMLDALETLLQRYERELAREGYVG